MNSKSSVTGTELIRRDVWLDVLRFAAIFLVLGSHLPDLPPNSETGISRLVFIWKRGGWVGVDLFFLLSGYLVSGLLFHEIQKKGSAKLSNFPDSAWIQNLSFVLFCTGIHFGVASCLSGRLPFEAASRR
jgi:peptidoglycan/LPS O-acetylase OafA/YrhL